MRAKLPSLSLIQLRELALQCGVNRSGTKGALVDRLVKTSRPHQPLSPDARVLSIDLGIRNLAYSLLSPPLRRGERRPLSTSKAFVTSPAVHAWRPLSLVPVAAEGAAASGDEDSPSDFSPASLSRIALSLVQDHLLPLKPTHVLIERQRFRSGGGAAVYEWTVRVNSLEAMLYATFSTLKALGHWDGVVLPVDPKRVGTFLLGDPKVVDDDDAELDGESPGCGLDAEEEARLTIEADTTKTEVKKSAGSSSRENKKRKVDLVGNWLANREIKMEGVEAEAMRIAFLERWLPKEYLRKPSTRPVEGKAESIKKLDDVADCLLQGIAWMRWEQNKTRLRSGQVFLSERR